METELSDSVKEKCAALRERFPKGDFNMIALGALIKRLGGSVEITLDEFMKLSISDRIETNWSDDGEVKTLRFKAAL